MVRRQEEREAVLRLTHQQWVEEETHAAAGATLLPGAAAAQPDAVASLSSEAANSSPAGESVQFAATEMAQLQSSPQVAQATGEGGESPNEEHPKSMATFDQFPLPAMMGVLSDAAAAAPGGGQGSNALGKEDPPDTPRRTVGKTIQPGSPSAESDGSMAAAQTSLESLAELEALLEEQHAQLIARGLIPADA